ncbi:MAG TPA: RNA polymerase sigma-70 factor [Anseongella sp.]
MRSLNVEFSDSAVVKMLREGSEQVFGQVFKTWFKPLHAYAFTILRDDAVAEEMVQNVFFNIWKKRERLEINGAVKSYLYRAVHNESLNYLKHQKVKAAYRVYYEQSPMPASESTDARLRAKELNDHIQKALNELPAQCRIIFQMSRFEEKKYREIAEELDISVKTVENQMGKALRLMRTKLAGFLPDAPMKGNG